MNGEQVPWTQDELMFIGDSAATGRSVLVVTDLQINVQDIEVANDDHAATLITQVFESGVYATLPWNAFDADRTTRGVGLSLHHTLEDFEASEE